MPLLHWVAAEGEPDVLDASVRPEGSVSKQVRVVGGHHIQFERPEGHLSHDPGPEVVVLLPHGALLTAQAHDGRPPTDPDETATVLEEGPDALTSELSQRATVGP